MVTAWLDWTRTAVQPSSHLEVLSNLPDEALEGELADRSSVLFWYLRISLPGHRGEHRWEAAA